MDKREYLIRSQCYRYRMISIPNECGFKVGDKVDLLFEDNLVVVVPRGTVVNEKLLFRAVKPA